MIDIERLKVDADYWDEVAPVGATHALHLEPEISFYVFRLTDCGLTYKLLQKNGAFVKGFDFYRDYPHETDRRLLSKPRKIDAQPSTASLLTDEQAEAAHDDCIDQMGFANFQKECERKASESHDPVNSPSHYASGGIECIDAMQAMLSREEFVGYLRGNIFKYQWRYKLKNGVEDLKKAQWYQNKLIEVEGK